MSVADIAIIYQDTDLLILSKPAGVVVNRASTVRGETVQDWLENSQDIFSTQNHTDWQDCIPEDFSDEFGTPDQIFIERSGIAHRLDKDTSGILVCARNPGALVHLLAQFKARVTTKSYMCLVHGRLASQQGVIDAPLGRRSGNRFLFGVVADGKPAVTEYFVRAEYSSLNEAGMKLVSPRSKTLYEAGFSLVECLPKTGRTHQIRVHLAHLQHALVGDRLYAGKKRSKLDPLWCPRQFLHAASIAVQHPRTGSPMHFVAPLTDDLTAVLELLVPTE